MPVGDISALPTDGETIMKLLDRRHAKAAILSWYDDNEWLVAQSTQSSGNPLN
jgi:hypothetical protein